jgi:hypothetical protein
MPESGINVPGKMLSPNPYACCPTALWTAYGGWGVPGNAFGDRRDTLEICIYIGLSVMVAVRKMDEVRIKMEVLASPDLNLIGKRKDHKMKLVRMQ